MTLWQQRTNNNMQTFIDFLEQYFIDSREFNGIPIIKDNAETLFERWLADYNYDEAIEGLAYEYGKACYETGKQCLANPDCVCPECKQETLNNNPKI